MDNSNHVPAAERTLRILESVVASQTGLTAAQLASTLHIPRSALYTLLNTLIQLGYIAQDGARKPYLPGPRLWSLNKPYPSETAALITAFHTETGGTIPEETLALAILNGQDAVIVAETPTAQTVRCVIPVGTRENALTHPAGLLLLAGLSQIALSETLFSFSDSVLKQLVEIHHNPTVIKHDNDMMTLAVPICPDGYHPEAAIMFCCPAFRWPQERAEKLTQGLLETAVRISHRLGARVYQPYADTAVFSHSESIPMSQEAITDFLIGPWTARLACIRPDGTPHVVPVWYAWEKGTFIIAAWPNSVWASMVRVNPTVALSIDEPWPPMRRVMVRGKAIYIPHEDVPEGIHNLRHRISARYLGKVHTIQADNDPHSTSWSAFSVTPQQCIALQEKPPEG